ncbi:hypothetical protein [Francisella sp. LA112445]|jgi:hypothetical protein|nr:hypothetical protein [Francisella sp. LA112445]
MKKIVIVAGLMVSLVTTSFGVGLHQVGGIANASFPPPVMNFA